MELFVVNRHEEIDEKPDEQKTLQNTLKRIERNKKLRLKNREKLLEHQNIKSQCIEYRAQRREFKSKIIPVPDVQEEFIDEHIINDAKVQDILVAENGPPKTDTTNIEGFTILGGDSFNKKAKVKRVLPRWLSNPKIISVDLKNLHTKVSKCKQLDKNIRIKLKEAGIKHLFPVQAEVIPWLIESNKPTNSMCPRDICVSAPTGSGKTLAFVLPIIQALKNHTNKQIRALVILPTQDLALQVFKTFKKFSEGTNIDVCLITGRSLFASEQKQLITENVAFGYLSKVDILVCTAGRLVDHLNSTKGFTLEYLKFLVIDEADRVLDSVQNDWLYHLEKHIYKNKSSMTTNRMLNLHSLKGQRPPQKLLFSATLSQDPEKIQKLTLFQPQLFTSVVETAEGEQNATEISDTFIGKYTTPRELTEKYIVCSTDLKPLVLYEFIKMEKLTKTIVFTHSMESTHRLTILLRSLFANHTKIEEISSNLEAKNRNTLIENFTRGDIDILVCTDSLARGIDLPGVKCVISYSTPKYLKTYIHRAGRTARAGEDGLAVTLLHKSQLNKFQSLLEQASKTNLEEIKIDEEGLEPLGEQYKDALLSLKKTIDLEGEEDLKKIKSSKRQMRKKRKRQNSE